MLEIYNFKSSLNDAKTTIPLRYDSDIHLFFILIILMGPCRRFKGKLPPHS